jgi:hypothetical protein
MKKIFLLLIFITILYSGGIYSQSCCGGSFYDIAVLSLDKQALFNVGINYDNYNGTWNQNGNWKKLNITSWQMRPLIAGAYRFNKYLQGGITIPYIINRNELPGLKPQASGIGDISVSGRFELFHEYQRYKSGERYKIDSKKPYLAFTFGLTLPTGKSDETAVTESEITGKGIYSTSLGISTVKSIIQKKFQIGLDLSWQHNFSKTYDKIYNEPLDASQKKKLGDRFNYGLSFIYLISDIHAASLAVGGFRQGRYRINEILGDNSDEGSLNLSASYTYYPLSNVRITPTFKWFIPKDDYGKNATGSTAYTINFVYYLEN